MDRWLGESRTYDIILDPVDIRIHLGIGGVGQIMSDGLHLDDSGLHENPARDLLPKLSVRGSHILLRLRRLDLHIEEGVREHVGAAGNDDPRIVPRLHGRDILHLSSSGPRILRVREVLLGVVGVGSSASREHGEQQRAVTEAMSRATEGDELPFLAGEVVLRRRQQGRARDQDHIVFARVRGRDRVVAAVVECEEVARRQVDVELAGKLTRLLWRPRRRGEEEDVAVLVDEFDELLRGERGAVAWWEEGRVSQVESMGKTKKEGRKV